MTGLNSPADIPAWWRDLLARVQLACPSAVIAGGCLRDRDNGREVKDIDIFISAVTMREADDAMAALRRTGLVVSFVPSEATAYPDDQHLEVVAIADVLRFELPVQLIFTDWPTSRIVDRFDYGICRLAFDGKSVTRPLEYDGDREAKVFRLRRSRPTPVSMRGSIHRYARLVQKYEGWTWWPFEQPEDFADLN